MRPNIRLKLLATIGLAITPSIAFAQDEGDEQVDITTMELPDELVIVTAAGLPQSVWKSGQSISIISSDVIERSQDIDVAESLERVPGVTVSRNGPLGGVTTVRIRGSESEQVLTLIDGQKVNDPSSPGGGFDFGNLLTSGVSRIEVLRGSNSVVWGSEAMGGVINVVTEAPSDEFTAKGKAEYGERDTYNITGTVSGAFGPIALSLTGGHFRTDGFSSAAVGTEDDGFRQTMAAARVRVDLGGAGLLRLNGFFGDGRLEIDGFPAPSYTFADTNEYSDTRQLAGQVSHEITLFGLLTSRLSYSISDIDRENYDPDNGFGAGNPGFIARGTTERFGWSGEARLGSGFTLIGGLAREKTRFRADNFAFFSFANGKTRIDSAHALINWAPSSRFAFSAGVRHDDHQTFGNQTTFGANGRFQVSDKGPVIRASYGEGFKAPTLYQLYSEYGNLALQPETSRTFDVGIEQRLSVPGTDLGATLGVTYFNRKTTNQIDFVSCFFNPDPRCATRPFGGFYDNLARTKAQGIEVEVGIQPTQGVDLSAAYAFIDTENRSPGSANLGKDLARRPRHALTFSADADVIGDFSIGGTVRLVGDSFNDVGNFTRLDGYIVASVHARYDFTDTIGLFGRVENLFDEQYQTVATYGTPGRAAFIGLRAGF